MKNALIYGITGQDGYYLTEELLEEGYDVTGVYRRTSTPLTGRINSLSQRVKLVQGDITDPLSVYKIISGLPENTEIYNLAAQSHVGTSFHEPLHTSDVTAKGCLNILEAMRVSERKDLKMIQASSSEMFGDNYSILDGVKYQNEETPFNPQSPYAVAKVAAYHYVRLYRGAYGIHASNSICFNHESPHRGETFVTRKITKYIGSLVKEMYEAMEGDIPSSLESIKNAIQLRKPQIEFPNLRLGDTTTYRDWGHARDYMRAMHSIITQDKPNDFVISTNQTHQISEFLRVAFEQVGLNADDWTTVNCPEFMRPSEVPFLRGDSSRIREELKWTHSVSFEELVREMLYNDIVSS